MPADTTVQRHADDLRDAVSWFKDQPLSCSSIEQLLNRVENIADRIAPSKVVALVGEYGYSRKVDDNGWRLV